MTTPEAQALPPAEIYRQSFSIIRAEADLDRLPTGLRAVTERMIHACGMVDLVDDIAWNGNPAASAKAALDAGKPILVDARMVAAGIIRSHLPADNDVLCTLDEIDRNDLPPGQTRSALAVDRWLPHLDGAVVAIGNAPTALFRLLAHLDAGAPAPACILGLPVGFVGAAESKELLASRRDVPFITLRGRRGGSAMAAAAVNALTVPAIP